MGEGSVPGFLDRAIANLRFAWRKIARTAYDATYASLRPDLPDADAERLRRQMRACLESRGGEVSARSRAAALGHAYLALDAHGRRRFLKILARDFDVDHGAVAEAAAELLRADGDAGARRQAEVRLHHLLRAPRRQLLTQFNALPDGVKFLVDMRAELIAAEAEDPDLGALEADLRGLLASWFDVGFLELRRIAWDTAPATLLEKLIAYEAVHAIGGWDDLKNRLDSDRRCFAFFHPRMPNEPLIFVEVALVDGLADNIQTLLDPKAPLENPADADTAIFYSISNTQKGLAGISFGNFLIKRVVDSLASEFRHLKTFATLSPVPGFRAWLDGRLAEGEPGLLAAAERKAIAAATGRASGGKGTLRSVLATPDWIADERLAAALRAPLTRLCARYLLEAKKTDQKTADPVAHFHLSNGARIGRINWLADRSAKGIEQSAGMMVNYVYRSGEIEANHEAYTTTGRVVAESAVRALLKD